MSRPKFVYIDRRVSKNRWLWFPITHFDTLKQMAEEKRAVYWRGPRKVLPAAIFINWNASQITRMLEEHQLWAVTSRQELQWPE